MMTILLYGTLGKRFGKIHKYVVSTPAEAIKALCATLKGFKEELAVGSYRILDGRLCSYGKENLNDPLSAKNTLRLIPVIEGSGGNGVFNIVLGAFLIWATWGGGMTIFQAGGALAGASSGVLAFGVSMVLGGVSSLLFSPEIAQSQTREAVENAPSFAFNGAINTTRQGNPVPVCYGRLIVGSQVISAGLSVEQVTL